MEKGGRVSEWNRGGSVLGRPDIQRVPQAVAEEIKRKERQREDGGREDEKPPVLLHGIGAVLDQDAERAHGRLHSQAEEKQEYVPPKEHHEQDDEDREGEGV